MNLLHNKNIVIGGSGFIGSELCFFLNKKGEGVLNISKETNPNLKDIAQKRCDVDDTEKLRCLLKGGENIYILIGQIYPGFDFKKEIKSIENVLNCLDKKTVKKIFYFSSVLLYGEVKNSVDEKYSAKPIDDYGKFKLECEKNILKRAEKDKFIAGILRLSNVYGKRGNRGFVGLLMENLFGGKNDKIIINGDGKQLRDYIFIDDVIVATVNIKAKLIESDIINVATGESYSLIDIIKKISNISEENIRYEIKNNEFFEIKNSLISNKKLIDKYKLFPKFNIEDGLKMTLENYKKI